MEDVQKAVEKVESAEREVREMGMEIALSLPIRRAVEMEGYLVSVDGLGNLSIERSKG